MSRVLKGGAGAQEFPWRGEPKKRAAGVGPFLPRRVGEPVDREPPEPPKPSIDLEAIRKQAFQEGVQAGQNAAEKRAADELSKKMASLGEVFGEIAGYKAVLRAEAEQELVDLAFAIARRIVRRELNVDPGAAAALIRSCMQEFPAVAVKRVLVHPDDLALVREAIGSGVEAAADASVPRGGAVLETDQGRLDARIDAQLEEIAAGLTDA